MMIARWCCGLGLLSSGLLFGEWWGGQAAAQERLLQAPALRESSGLAEVRGQELWSHNDSGDEPRLFVFGQDGSALGEVHLPEAEAVDWEDMCSFTRDGRQYVAVGDVGDNGATRRYVVLYVIEVPPRAPAAQPPAIIQLPLAARVEVTYPDGPVNCEALAYDPRKQVFVLATKELLTCRLFEVDARRLQGTQRLQARQVSQITLPLVTGGDISPDGQLMVLSTYGPGCLIQRGSDGNWQTATESGWQMFELPARRQGESICFSQDGRRLWLSSEFVPTPLYELPVPVPGR
ncbi:MAG: hypothetical protein KDA45_09100 [Planctomycetales bacterium]|nr:hypothetical protein [Planctomycetales bacterium]